MYVIVFVIIVIIAIFSGLYIYKIVNPSKENQNNNNNNDVINNTIIKEELYGDKNNILIDTNSNEEKTTPNTSLILKKHYNECNHTIKEYSELPSKSINLTQKEIEEEYKEWNIEEFSSKKIILIKEESGNCNQHYVLKEKNGVIAIYNIDKNGVETLKETTSISVEYLTQTDLLKIKQGIKVYGEEELNSTIEDFE